jgi:transcriptional regulator with XRE-family HTH domain
MAQRRITSPGFRDQRYRKVIERLRLRRQELGLSQQTLAERLGLHKQFISRVELGERRLDVVEFVDLVRALELDPAKVLKEIP